MKLIIEVRISKSAYCAGFFYDDLPLAIHALALCGENASPEGFGVL